MDRLVMVVVEGRLGEEGCGGGGYREIGKDGARDKVRYWLCIYLHLPAYFCIILHVFCVFSAYSAYSGLHEMHWR